MQERTKNCTCSFRPCPGCCALPLAPFQAHRGGRPILSPGLHCVIGSLGLTLGWSHFADEVIPHVILFHFPISLLHFPIDLIFPCFGIISPKLSIFFPMVLHHYICQSLSHNFWVMAWRRRLYSCWITLKEDHETHDNNQKHIKFNKNLNKCIGPDIYL